MVSNLWSKPIDFRYYKITFALFANVRP
jgi:hypothetical protein